MTREAQIEALLSKQPKQLTNDSFRRVSTEDLFAVLHELSNRPKSFHAAAAITKYLIQERGAEPSPQLYECLIACARDPQASAEMIAQLLAEIRELKLPTGSMLFHDALEVCTLRYYMAVHVPRLTFRPSPSTPTTSSGTRSSGP